MTKFSTINETTYAYSVEGEGEPLVLLHGFTGRKETWHPIIKKLNKSYQVITLDLPGHGQTVAKNKVTMEQFVQDFYELMKQLTQEPFHLLGYSLGGRSALTYALHYPKTVRTLTLESASPGLKTESERLKRRRQDRQLVNMMLEQGLNHFVDYWERIPLFSTQRRLHEEIKLRQRNERLSQTAYGLSQSLLGMGTGAQPSWWEHLTKITFPVLLIIGEEDKKFVRINKEMHKRIKTSELTVVEEVGHAVHLEQIDEFLSVVKDFIDKN